MIAQQQLKAISSCLIIISSKKESSLTIIIDDIIWLDTIVEKLAWKHGVIPHEVEEVLSGRYRIFKREGGKVEGRRFI